MCIRDRVKGTIHWLSAPNALTTTVMLYNNLFTVENMGEIDTADYDKYLNPESVIEIDDAKIEPSLGEARPGEKFQFVRTGYFTPDSKHVNRFNRIVSLKDGYKF